ncbi:MAG: TolC family protein [Bacteroidota bacterium]
MLTKYTSIFLLSLAFFTQNAKAQVQESMMTEVSYIFLEKLIATAKENYPRLNTFKSREAIAKSVITSQKSAWLDGLSFSYIYQPNNTLNIVNPSFFNGYQVAVQFSVNSLFQKSGAVKQAKEQLKLVNYDKDEYNLTLETQVKSRYFTYIQHLISLRLQSKAYADAQSLNKDIGNKYSKGEVTFTDFLQAQMVLNNSMQGKIGAESNFLTAKASLEELLTKKIEEVQ